ncbi:MAG: protein translocase subunit SecF [Pseudolabrys sp.]
MPLLRFLPEATTIDFVGARYFAFAIDGLLLLASIVSIAVHGFNLGIDFTGGVQLEVKYEQTIDVQKLRASVDRLGFKEAEITSVGGGQCDSPSNSCALIRVQPQSDEANQAVSRKIVGVLGNAYKVLNIDVVGPKVSGELFDAGILATLVSVAFIALWVAFRFEWQYGVSAALATGHDVLVTAGLYSLLHLDFTLTSIAALLTLAGYSINDTVVVFDRIRENRRKYKRMGLGDLINLSTNQMLTRTILTSAATAISIIPLLIFGGPSLFDFSAAILFGIVVGTFSSIYVAAALLLYLPQLAGGSTSSSAGEAVA